MRTVCIGMLRRSATAGFRPHFATIAAAQGKRDVPSPITIPTTHDVAGIAISPGSPTRPAALKTSLNRPPSTLAQAAAQDARVSPLRQGNKSPIQEQFLTELREENDTPHPAAPRDSFSTPPRQQRPAELNTNLPSTNGGKPHPLLSPVQRSVRHEYVMLHVVTMLVSGAQGCRQ